MKSERTKGYNLGYAKGYAAGKRAGIIECHDAFKADKELPKIPASRMLTAEQKAEKVAKIKKELTKILGAEEAGKQLKSLATSSIKEVPDESKKEDKDLSIEDYIDEEETDFETEDED